MNESAQSGTLLDPAFIARLERLALVARKVQLGRSQGERRSKRKGQSVEFADYRDYVQGDDLRHVDWNTYARLEALYLKLFEEQEDLTLSVIVDASRSMAFGLPTKFAFACRLAAALGYIALAGGDRVQVEMWSETPAALRPVRGKASARKLFMFLEEATAQGAMDLAENARRFATGKRARGVTVLVSDLFDEDGPAECFRRLQQTRSEMYVVQVLAPEEIDPDLTGDLKLRDSETGNYTEISMSSALLARYKKNRDGFLEEIRQLCLRRGIPHFVVASDTPVERLTLGILRRGGLVRT